MSKVLQCLYTNAGLNKIYLLPFLLKQPQSFSCISPNAESTRYHFVSVCPKENTDIQTAVQCEAADPGDVFTSIPCYGRSNGVHYRNIYCALCHGEELTDVIPWEVVVDCADAFWQTTEEAAQLLQRSIANLGRVKDELGCDVIFEAPNNDDVIFPPRCCYPDVVRRCPTPRHALSDACDSYTALTVTNLNGGQLYRNPHCALCNLPNGPDRIEYATDCTKDMPIFYLSGSFHVDVSIYDSIGAIPPVFARPPPLSIIFDFRSDSKVKITQNSYVLKTESVQCPQNEVYDPFDSRCRRLSCSAGYILDDNKCFPDFGSMRQACGDSEGDDDIDVGLTVSFHDQCKDDQPGWPDGVILSEDIQQCLEEFAGFDQGLVQVASSNQSTDCPRVTKYSFLAKGSSQTLRDLSRILKLSIPFPSTPYCWMFDVSETWSVELTHRCEDMPTEKCTGRKLNDTEFSLSVQNGTTLVYVNASESWYAMNQTIIQANFQRRENSYEQFTNLQICAEPTLSCPQESFNSSLFQNDEHSAGSIIYTPTGDIFMENEYIRTQKGEIKVCSFNENNGTQNNTYMVTFFDYSAMQQSLSLAGNIISMIAAAITFLTYCVFKELRKRISVAIMGLVACLFTAQFLLLISGSATSNQAACTVVAFLGHFFWLATVLWTAVLAFDLNRTFAFRSKLRRVESDMRVVIVQVLFTVGVSMVIVVPCLIIHLCDCTDIPLWYGNERVCWIGNGYAILVAFGLPIGVIVLVNGVLFSFTVRGIRATKKQAQAALNDQTDAQKMRQELLIYVKVRKQQQK